MTDKKPGKNIPGGQSTGAGDAARAALERLRGKRGASEGTEPAKPKGAVRQAAGDAADVATRAAKGAAGGTLASKAVGGGVQGAVLEGAVGAARSKTARNAFLAGAACVGLLAAPMLGGAGGGGTQAALTDQAVAYENGTTAAEASGYNMENFQTVYEIAGADLLDWEMVAAIEHWQANQNTQQYCPPAPPSEDDPENPPEDPEEPPEDEEEPGVQLNEAGDTAHPVTGNTYRVTSAFGTRIITDGQEGTNQGLDFGDDAGTDLVGVAAGEVVYSGWNDTGGNMVWVDLAGTEVDTQVRYMHLESVNVAVGDQLDPGDVVGWMGETGTAERVILHLEILEDGQYVNPATWLEDRDIVVNHGLPVDPRFSDPCSGRGGPGGGGGGIGGGGYEGSEFFPGPPGVTCPTIPSSQVVGAILSPATPDQSRGRDCVAQAFPQLLLTSAYRTVWMGYPSDHHQGNALDWAISPYHEGSGGWALMYTLAHWAQVNADNLGIKSIIFADWRWDRQTGWTPYTFTSSNNDNARHINHVHLSFFGTSAMPDAGNLVPAWSDGSGMPYQPGYNTKWSDGKRFFPIDEIISAIESIPKDGSGGIIIGGGGGGIGIIQGDFRSPYKIDRAAFGPDDEQSEAELAERLESDPDFAREWEDREEKGWVARHTEDAEALAVKADEDFEYATGWVSFELARIMQEQNTIDYADLDSGRIVDAETGEVSVGDATIVETIRSAYVDALAELPVAGMNPSSADIVYGVAQGWHFGETAAGGGGNIPGVICSPAGGQVLQVQAVGGPNAGEIIVMDSKKLGYAATAVYIADQAGLNDNGKRAMLMTIFQESRFKMYANSTVPVTLTFPHDDVGNDHDSAGLYQQRVNSQAWGPVESIMDVSRSTKAFLGVSNESTAPGLLDIPGWETMPPGALAQRVQVSAHPTLYNQWEEAANQVLGEVMGIECTPEDDPDNPEDPEDPAEEAAGRDEEAA